MSWNGRTERSSADGAGEAGSSADAAQREEASGSGVDGRMELQEKETALAV